MCCLQMKGLFVALPAPVWAVSSKGAGTLLRLTCFFKLVTWAGDHLRPGDISQPASFPAQTRQLNFTSKTRKTAWAGRWGAARRKTSHSRYFRFRNEGEVKLKWL